MQRIQKMRKIFENIEYWKSELFHGNEILEITIFFEFCVLSYEYIASNNFVFKKFEENRKFLNCTELIVSTRKVSQFSHPLNKKECGHPSLD